MSSLAIEHRQAEINALFAQYATRKPQPKSENILKPDPGQAVPESEIRAQLDCMKARKPVEKLLAGDFSAYGSQSQGDLALCNMLAVAFGGNRKAMDQAFRMTGLYRSKWDEKHYSTGQTYGEATIHKAAEGFARRFPAKYPTKQAQLYISCRARQEGMLTLYYHNADYYAYQGTHFAPLEIEQLRGDIRQWAGQYVTLSNDGDFVPVAVTSRLIDEILDALCGLLLMPKERQAPQWIGDMGPDPLTCIACQNGLLHVPTGYLMPNTPRFWNHNAVRFAFDPEARCDAFLAFVHEIFAHDPSAIHTLQELLGYLLTRDTRQQKIFLIVGPKRSGKGTLARVIFDLVGRANCASPTLAGLSTNFGLQPLIGKQVALISDARLSGRHDQAVITERLLSISGEDYLTIDRKYQSGWTGKLNARFLIMTNELPRLSDSSGALAGRFIILTLQKSFYGREDPTLSDRLLEELPGILNWSLAGLRRLLDRGHFVQPDTAAEAIDELYELSSPVGAFVSEWLDIGAAFEMPAQECFYLWRYWCGENGRRQPGTIQTFSRDLHAAVPCLGTSRMRDGAARIRIFRGIRKKPDMSTPDPYHAGQFDRDF